MASLVFAASPQYSQHHRIAAGAEFARDIDRHYLAIEVDDLDLDMRVDAPDAADPPLERIVGRGLQADGTGFGHAEDDGEIAQMHV